MEQTKDTTNQPIKLTDKINELSEKLDVIVDKNKGKSKDKQFKLKWGMRTKLKQISKKKQLLVFLLQTNRNIKPVIANIIDGMIQIENCKYHYVDQTFVYLYDGKTPAIVLPEWSLIPIGTKDYYDNIADNKIDPQKIIIRAMELHAVETKKKMNMMMLIVIGIAALVAGFVFLNKK